MPILINRFALLAAVLPVVIPVGAQNTSFDISANFGTIGSSAYFVSSQSPSGSVVAGTGNSNPDPELTLEIGRRYRFNIPFQNSHPFNILTSPSNTKLLRQTSSRVGSFESNAAVGWFDDGANLYFTLTPELAEALAGAGKSGRYQCEFHGSMTGDIVIKERTSGLVFPSGVEDFNNSIVGTRIENAFLGWSIGSGNSNYSAVMANTPTGHPGMPADRVRWLRIVDNDGSSAANRVQSPAIVAANTAVRTHAFEWFLNVETHTGPNIPIVTQLLADGSYKGLAGVEVTEAGANLLLVGTNNDGIGLVGNSARVNLFSFGDPGGFSRSRWIKVRYEVDYEAGVIRGEATGTDGEKRNATLSGLTIQGSPNRANFRLSIQNDAPGATSTINHCQLIITGTGNSTNNAQLYLLR